MGGHNLAYLNDVFVLDNRGDSLQCVTKGYDRSFAFATGGSPSVAIQDQNGKPTVLALVYGCNQRNHLIQYKVGDDSVSII